MKLPKGLTKFRTLSGTDGFLRMTPFVFVYLSTLFVTECSAGFFFNPFSSGRYQQQDNVPAASRRSETNGGFLDRMGLAPAETLWIGSNKINWGPLPLFLQFSNPNQHKQQQLQQHQQKEAQARKFNFGPFQQNQFKNPFDNQKHLFPYPQSISAGLPPPPPLNPISSTPYPPLSLSSPYPQPFAESRSSVQPPTEDHYYTVSRYNPTTPLPLVSSPSLADSIFPRDTSTPTSLILSTPSDNLNPIIAQLRKMTEWSKSRQKTSLVKKEGKYGHSQGQHGRHNLKNKIKKKNKDRSNIEAIILADDDDQDAELPPLKRVQKFKRKSINSKELTAPSDLIVIHPTNAAHLLIDPMEVQQSALKKYQINRKDKKLGMFRSEDAIERPAPFSFKFGPQDAKPSPYRQ